MKKLVAVMVAVIVGIVLCGTMYAAEKSAPAAKQPGTQIVPKKVSVDTNFDGKPDRTESYDEAGRITKVEVDANGDGFIEETVIYADGKPVKSARDTNGDGKPDVWVDF